MEPGGPFIHAYVEAKLCEIDAALDELDRDADVEQSHEARKELVAQQGRLVATLATFADDPPSMN